MLDFMTFRQSFLNFMQLRKTTNAEYPKYQIGKKVKDCFKFFWASQNIRNVEESPLWDKK